MSEHEAAERPSADRPALKSAALTIQSALLSIAEGTASHTGNQFFLSLVKNLATALGTRQARLCVRVRPDSSRLRTIAAWCDGDFVGGTELEATGTPSADVLEDRVVEHLRDLGQMFPALTGSESYIGVPIHDSAGAVSGELGLTHDQPLDDEIDRTAILRIAAARTGAELERMRVEQALRESEERYRALYRDNPSMYFTLDPEGTVISVNDFGASQLGRRPDDLVGRSVLSVFHEEDRPEVVAQLRRSLQSPGQVLWWKFRKVRPDGTIMWVEELARTVQDENGETRVLIVCNDISDRVAAEKEREKLELRIQSAQKLESLGVLAGGVAHDFNNLLTGVLGNAQLARDHVENTSPAARSIDSLERAALRAAEMCKQLLAYSGKGQFETDLVDLNEIVEETAHLLDLTISNRVNLDFHLSPELPTVRADATQMRQVVMNLLTNASEAIGDNDGTITILTGLTEGTSELLANNETGEELEPGPYVFVEFRDTGCGMDDETRKRIFDPFFTTKFTGRGLGLAAVQGIMRGHQGAITIQSATDLGSKFKVLLPRAGAAPTWMPSDGPVQHSWRGSGIVLLVDDEEAVREVGKPALERLGFQVITASSGDEAIAIFEARDQEIKLVVLDVTMPGMSGDQTFERLRSVRADVPIILSSGYDEQQATQRFAGRELAGFLSKPYHLDELLERVRSVVGGTSAEASSS